MADLAFYQTQAQNTYQPQKDSIQSQINAIPGQLETALNDVNKSYDNRQTQLDTQRDDYNRGTYNNASRAGLGWSNIAGNYQADYNKNSYTPAATTLSTNRQADINKTTDTSNTRKYSLEDTLNSLTNEQNKYAMAQWQTAQDREQQAAQEAARLAAQRAAAQANVGAYLGGGSGGGQTPIFDDYNGKYTSDPNGKWNAQTGVWSTANGDWKWNAVQNAWQLVGRQPANEYDWKVFTPKSNNTLSGSLGNKTFNPQSAAGIR